MWILIIVNLGYKRKLHKMIVTNSIGCVNFRVCLLYPYSLRCASCDGVLADAGFVRNAGRALCRECHAKEKASGLGRCLCHRCHTIIDEPVLRFKGKYLVVLILLNISFLLLDISFVSSYDRSLML